MTDHDVRRQWIIHHASYWSRFPQISTTNLKYMNTIKNPFKRLARWIHESQDWEPEHQKSFWEACQSVGYLEPTTRLRINSRVHVEFRYSKEETIPQGSIISHNIFKFKKGHYSTMWMKNCEIALSRKAQNFMRRLQISRSCYGTRDVQLELLDRTWSI
jgi:hypothetical protein